MISGLETKRGRYGQKASPYRFERSSVQQDVRDIQ